MKSRSTARPQRALDFTAVHSNTKRTARLHNQHEDAPSWLNKQQGKRPQRVKTLIKDKQGNNTTALNSTKQTARAAILTTTGKVMCHNKQLCSTMASGCQGRHTYNYEQGLQSFKTVTLFEQHEKALTMTLPHASLTSHTEKPQRKTKWSYCCLHSPVSGSAKNPVI